MLSTEEIRRRVINALKDRIGVEDRDLTELTKLEDFGLDELDLLVGDFTWDFGSNYFVETSVGNFIYNSLDHTIRCYDGTLKDYFGKGYGRDKGFHVIKDFVEPDTVFR